MVNSEDEVVASMAVLYVSLQDQKKKKQDTSLRQCQTSDFGLRSGSGQSSRILIVPTHSSMSFCSGSLGADRSPLIL